MSSKHSEIVQLLIKGNSYREISKKIKVSKSTISYNFSKLDETAKQKIRFFRIQNWKESSKFGQENRKNILINKEKAIQGINSKLIGNISKRELLLAGACLYWAEGSKNDRWHLQFSNSDPLMIRLIMSFFRDVCSVSEIKFYMQLILHQNIDEAKAKSYWSTITNVPVKQFKKACFSKSIASKNKRPKNTLPYGTLQVRIFDKSIVHKVYGYINGLKDYAGIV